MTRPVLRWFLALAAVLACAVALPLGFTAPALAGPMPVVPVAADVPGATGESITRYDVEATLSDDGSMLVVENVTWDFGGRAGHGIRRAITTAQDTRTSGEYRRYRLSEISVTSPSGASTDLSVSAQGPNTVLRIGSADRTVTGAQQYTIRYRIHHVVNKVGDTVELAWNFPGLEVGVPVKGVSIRVAGPGQAMDVGCVAGPAGSSTQCPAAVEGRGARFSPPDLAPHSTATVALKMPAEAFTDTAPDLRQGAAMDHGFRPGIADEWPVATARAVSLTGFVGGPLLALLGIGAMGWNVWRRGRDEQYLDAIPGLGPARFGDERVRRGTTRMAAVQFSPPDDIEPGLLGTVLDEEANPIDVSATVVDLAARGYLTIAEVEGSGGDRDDWLLTRTDKPWDGLKAYELTLLESIFSFGGQVQLSALRRHFAGTLASAQRQMYAEVVERGWFRASPERQRARWRVLGGALAVAGLIGVGFAWGYGRMIDERAGMSWTLPSLAVLCLGAVVAGVFVFWMSRHMAWRTAKGSAVQAQSLGFREYLATAEAGQIRFEEAAGIFSRYLPYAIVYGVADRWSRTFEEVAKAAEAAGTPLTMPGWYLFSYPGFGFGGFGSRLDDFATTSTGTFAASSAAATAGSSGDSVFSGGGGSFGGFSGGGGGGGGFDSW